MVQSINGVLEAGGRDRDRLYKLVSGVYCSGNSPVKELLRFFVFTSEDGTMDGERGPHWDSMLCTKRTVHPEEVYMRSNASRTAETDVCALLRTSILESLIESKKL